MDANSMSSFVWRLMFIFLIYVPGSTLNVIQNSTVTAASTARTSTITTTLTSASSLHRKAMDDKTLPKTQLSTLATLTTTAQIHPLPSTITSILTRGTPATTTEATATRINDASTRKATNVRFSMGTKDSLNPSTTMSTIIGTNAMTSKGVAAKSAAAAIEAATIAVAAAAVAAAAAEQVTIGKQWTTEATNIGANNGAYKTLNNELVGGITDSILNHNYNFKTKINNNNSSNTKEESQITSGNSVEAEHQQQSLLEKPENPENSLSQEVAPGNFKQYVRQVQQELSTTAITSDNKKAIVAATYEETMRVYELPVNDKLKMATTTVEATATQEQVESFNEASTVAASTVTVTTALPAAAMTTLASSLTTTRVDSTTTSTSTMKTTTTTAKPALPLAVDGYQTITSQAGTHAYLPCNVKQLVKKPISWLRVRDGHILTVDQTTFIADQRFQSIYTPNPERWSLQIKYVQTKDAGTYECQVSTEPKTSAIVTLLIVEPKTELIGESTRHVKAGSQVKLRCIISQALEPPVFINWFYNQKQIYLHNRRDWRTEIERIELTPETSPTAAATSQTATTIAIEVATSSTLLANVHPSMSLSAGKDRATGKLLASAVTFPTTAAALTTTTTTTTPTTTTTAAAADVKQITTASLIIPSVEKQDSGNYTCSPSNSAPMTVVLHVLNGEFSASAITSGISSNLIFYSQRHFHWCNATNIFTLFWLVWFIYSLKLDNKMAFTENKRATHNYTFYSATETITMKLSLKTKTSNTVLDKTVKKI